MENNQIAEAVIYYVVFLFSTTLHEAAHAWVAMLGGDLTAYHGGQVSLDPRPHIRREPFGMVILPVISLLASGWPFGFASTPYDPYWARSHPKRSA
ncbi:MAG TPA: site-2 protease family protein, partial [Terriglobia bacterium]|nr:site-2 protease family protein [Terriglobia bacterium]